MTGRAPAGAVAPDPIDPIDVCDLLLERLLREAATSVWIDPRDGDVHEVSFEHRGAALGHFHLSGGLGDAVLARLALIAGLDLLAGGSQAGTARVRLGDHCADVVVAIRAATGGLAGEVRLFDERATTVAGGRPGAAEVFEPGTRVGPYRVERVIGRGGMGVVYEVEHTSIAKRFAMKVLFGSVLARDPASALRFVREARAAARVRHPGIVDVSDFGTLGDGRPYLVMALLAGRSLYQVAADEGPLAPARALDIARQIAGALRAAHRCGVVHRDLTLANVFLQRDADGGERVVLVDFGSATVPDPEHGEVPDGPPGLVIGTPHYMSPEQLRGRATDARSDLYSLGVILHELLTGRPPYDAPTPREIALMHLRDPIPPLSSPHQELPPELVALVASLLAKDPADRPGSAGEVLATLERCQRLLSRRGWRRLLPR